MERKCEDGISTVVFESDPSVDVRHGLFRLLASKDVPLVGLENVSLTLEDIFARLTMTGGVK